MAPTTTPNSQAWDTNRTIRRSSWQEDHTSVKNRVTECTTVHRLQMWNSVMRYPFVQCSRAPSTGESELPRRPQEKEGKNILRRSTGPVGSEYEPLLCSKPPGMGGSEDCHNANVTPWTYFLFFGGQTLNLKPIIFFLKVWTLNLEPNTFFLNGQTLNLGPFAAQICEPGDLEPQTLNLRMGDFSSFNPTAEWTDTSPLWLWALSWTHRFSSDFWGLWARKRVLRIEVVQV
jgi:hypothetical protein